MRGFALVYVVACGGQIVPPPADAGAPEAAADVGAPEAAADTSTCDAPRTMCGSACVDTRTDKDHCGDCSTACSFCTASKCGESHLADATTGTIAAMAADDDGVYALTYSKGAVLGCPFAGCGGTMTILTMVADHPYSQGQLVAGGGYVFWTDGAILTCPTSGCSAPTTYASMPDSNLVTDGVDLFFVLGGSLVSCPVAGCTKPKTITNTGATRIALTGNDVVMVNGASMSTCAKTGCASPWVVPGVSSVWAFTAGGHFAGVTQGQSSSETVFAIDLGPDGPLSYALASAEDAPFYYAQADDVKMFWVDFDIPKLGVLKSCPWLKYSNTPTIITSTLAPAPTGPAYAIGGAAVAWVDGAGIRVAEK